MVKPKSSGAKSASFVSPGRLYLVNTLRAFKLIGEEGEYAERGLYAKGKRERERTKRRIGVGRRSRR